jgi:hypothetical protein
MRACCLRLNDEALHALRGIAIEGTVRFGAPTDVAEDYLPEILKASPPRMRA